MSRSKFGIVILSHNFFTKEWPQRELDALIAKEYEGSKIILPIWHDISREEIASYSPIIADRLAADTSKGLKRVVEQIVTVLGDPAGDLGNDLIATTKSTFFDKVLACFIPRHLKSFHKLPSGTRAIFEDRLRMQEHALRLLLGVPEPTLLGGEEKEFVVTAFTPLVDPRVLV